MGLPYETATSGEKALTELQRTLAKFGCQSFGTMTDAEKGCTMVQFKWRNRTVSLEASWKGYAAAWQRAHPWAKVRGNDRAAYDRKALEIGKVAVCSVLRDWVKGQITTVECGVLSFEAAFMPHMLLADGRRVLDKVQSDNLLPAPDEPSKVVRIGGV